MRRSTTKRLTYMISAIAVFILLWKISRSGSVTTTSLSDIKKVSSKQAPDHIVEEHLGVKHAADEPAPSSTPYDPAAEVSAALESSPVVIFSKSYCPFSKKAKFILQNLYAMYPQPKIIEIDLHENGPELQQYLRDKTGRGTVPNVFVGGESRGGGDDLEKLHFEDVLVSSFRSWTENSLSIVPDQAQIAAYNDLRAQ